MKYSNLVGLIIISYPNVTSAPQISMLTFNRDSVSHYEISNNKSQLMFPDLGRPSLLQKVHHHQFQTPLHRWLWPSLVKVLGDSIGDHRRFKTDGGMLHRSQIDVQSSGVAITFTAASKFDPLAIGWIRPPVWQTIQRWWWRHQHRLDVPSSSDERDINFGLAYDLALM